MRARIGSLGSALLLLFVGETTFAGERQWEQIEGARGFVIGGNLLVVRKDDGLSFSTRGYRDLRPVRGVQSAEPIGSSHFSVYLKEGTGTEAVYSQVAINGVRLPLQAPKGTFALNGVGALLVAQARQGESEADSVLLQSSDRGNQWQPLAAPAPGMLDLMRGGGDFVSLTAGDKVLVSHDGTTWKSLGDDVRFRARVAMRDKGDQLELSRNGGRTWTRFKRPPFYSNADGVRTTFALDGKRIASFDLTGRVHLSEDAGATWTDITPPKISGTILEIAVRDEEVLLGTTSAVYGYTFAGAPLAVATAPANAAETANAERLKPLTVALGEEGGGWLPATGVSFVPPRGAAWRHTLVEPSGKQAEFADLLVLEEAKEKALIRIAFSTLKPKAEAHGCSAHSTPEGELAAWVPEGWLVAPRQLAKLTVQLCHPTPLGALSATVSSSRPPTGALADRLREMLGLISEGTKSTQRSYTECGALRVGLQRFSIECRDREMKLHRESPRSVTGLTVALSNRGSDCAREVASHGDQLKKNGGRSTTIARGPVLLRTLGPSQGLEGKSGTVYRYVACSQVNWAQAVVVESYGESADSAYDGVLQVQPLIEPFTKSKWWGR